MDEIDLRWITAEHEAAHAVMRWLRGLPATDVYVGNGDGLCEGTGAALRAEDALLVTLAGLVIETTFGLYTLDSVINPENEPDDLVEAREILEGSMLLRMKIPVNPQPGQPALEADFWTVEESLQLWLKRAVSELCPHCDLVDVVATAAFDGYLSAADLQAILDEYEQELESNG